MIYNDSVPYDDKYSIYDMITYAVIDPDNQLDRALCQKIISCRLLHERTIGIWVGEYNRVYLQDKLNSKLWIIRGFNSVENVLVKELRQDTVKVQFDVLYGSTKDAVLNLDAIRIVTPECYIAYKMVSR